ncbi:MAG TPA: TetR family transcriptional regulator C-terminal domain-containing protein [Propylenella sp.]
MNRPEPPPRKATRIQRKNREAILEAALRIFSAHGFRGATIDRIAEQAGLSKPNLLYYFPSKHAIYVAVLEDTLEEWLLPLRELDAAGDPLREIGRYVEAKLEMSRTRPEASRLFANEILHGAPAIGDFLKGPLKQLVDMKAAVIERWIAEGRLSPVDPRHLIMMVWAVTQHYADFDVQVQAVLGPKESKRRYRRAGETVAALLLEGLRPHGRRQEAAVTPPGQMFAPRAGGSRR